MRPRTHHGSSAQRTEFTPGAASVPADWRGGGTTCADRRRRVRARGRGARARRRAGDERRDRGRACSCRCARSRATCRPCSASSTCPTAGPSPALAHSSGPDRRRRRAAATTAPIRTAAADATTAATPGGRPPRSRARPAHVVRRAGRPRSPTSSRPSRPHRLVTALGPGGVGKTRLATAVAGAVADRWRDGVWFVDLVPVTDEALVPAAVSRTLGLADSPGRSSEDHVLAHLSDREALLVLDNCEHLVAGVGVFVERLLGRCPGVTVLATSQARLMLPFERVFTVPGLSLPQRGRPGRRGVAVPRAGRAGRRPRAPRRPTGRASARSAAGSTAAPSPSSWRPPGCPRSASTASSGASASGSTCCRAGRGSTSATSRCARRSTGATACSTRPTRRCCGGCRSSPPRSPPRRRRRWPATTNGPGEPGSDAPARGGRRASPGSPSTACCVTAPGERTRHRVLDSIRQYGLARMAESRRPPTATTASPTS